MQHLLLEPYHQQLGAQLTDFHGWKMPARYSSIKEEVLAVRTGVGIFDISHMGEIIIDGNDAEIFLDTLLPNAVAALHDGQALYSPLCREDGTIVDDLLVYRFTSRRYMLVVNASNRQKDYDHIAAAVGNYAVTINDISDTIVLLAVQGPQSANVVRNVFPGSIDNLNYFYFTTVSFNGHDILIARTGYTGEHGYELYIPAEAAESVWKELYNAGQEYALKPCGLGARDVLRLEAGLSLYGNEIDDTTSPFDAGIGWTVKQKGNMHTYIGYEALLKAKQHPKKTTIGIITSGRIPRKGTTVLKDGTPLGVVTSGTFSFALNNGIALCAVTPHSTAPDDVVTLDLGSGQNATVVRPPFIMPQTK